MANYLRTIITFPHATGLPEDSVVNTLSWIGTDVGTRATQATAITTALNTFYGAVKANLSSAYNWNSGTYEYIDMADAKPRVAFQTDTAALGTLSTSGNDFPPEVALCCSMRGATGSGLNMKRRRGRFYLGPLQQLTGDRADSPTAIVDTVATALAALMTVPNVALAVFSPSTFHGVPVGGKLKDYPDEIPALLDDSFVPVTKVWVDNAWDVQRRRGTKATYRKTL